MIPEVRSNHTTRAFNRRARAFKSYHVQVQIIPRARSNHTTRAFKSYRPRVQIVPRARPNHIARVTISTRPSRISGRAFKSHHARSNHDVRIPILSCARSNHTAHPFKSYRTCVRIIPRVRWIIPRAPYHIRACSIFSGARSYHTARLFKSYRTSIKSYHTRVQL